MTSPANLASLIKKVAEVPESNASHAFYQFYIEYKKDLREMIHAYLHNECNILPNSPLGKSIFSKVLSEIYENIRVGKFKPETYPSDSEMVFGLRRWIRKKAMWVALREMALFNKLKRGNIKTASELEEIRDNKNIEPSDTIEETWPDYSGRGNGLLNLNYQDTKRNVEKAIGELCEKYADIIRLYIMTDGKPLRAEKVELMKKHNISNEICFNTSKYNAVNRLKEILDKNKGMV